MSSIEKMMERLAQQKREKTAVVRGEVQEALPVRIVAKVSQKSQPVMPATKCDRKEEGQNNGKCSLDIELDHLAAAGYLPDDYETSCQFNEFRRIKRPILKKAFMKEKGKDDLPCNMVMVSSAIPGEGKTFSTINLMLNMIIERDITVLLMDVDCIRRSLSKIFGLEASAGLIDVLMGESKLEDVIVNTSIPQLKIIPAGRACQYTAELLGSERMKQLAAEMAERYSDRIILMDTPPLLAGNDAEVISHYVGQALVVVEAGSTPQALIQQALAHIDTARVATGLVLNKRQRSSMGTSENYDYYGDYNSGVNEEGKG